MFENISLGSVLIFLGLVLVIWIALRFLLRFTVRIFTCGILVLAAIGIAVLLIRLL